MIENWREYGLACLLGIPGDAERNDNAGILNAKSERAYLTGTEIAIVRG